jgi:hypothetical protein
MMNTKYTETDFNSALAARISNFENSMDDLAGNVRATKERIDHVKYLMKEPERELQNVSRMIRENPITFFAIGSFFALSVTWMSIRKSRIEAQQLFDEQNFDLELEEDEHFDDSYGI